MTYYNIIPIPKPRITHKGRFKPIAKRYYCYADNIRALKVDLPLAGSHVTFHMPMPKSWSEKKKTEMNGTPHQSKKDLDNLFKALGDAVYSDDSSIWDVRMTKLWSRTGGIKIEPQPPIRDVVMQLDIAFRDGNRELSAYLINILKEYFGG